MRRNFALLAVAVVLLAAQASLLRHSAARTDVATLMVVYLALERAVLPGAGLALAVGYLSDVSAGTDRGLLAFTAVVLFFAIRLVVARFGGGRFGFVTSIAVVGTLLSLAFAMLVERTIGPGTVGFRAVSPALPSLLLSSTSLGYPIYRLLKLIDERFREPEDDFVFRG